MQWLLPFYNCVQQTNDAHQLFPSSRGCPCGQSMNSNTNIQQSGAGYVWLAGIRMLAPACTLMDFSVFLWLFDKFSANQTTFATYFRHYLLMSKHFFQNKSQCYALSTIATNVVEIWLLDFVLNILTECFRPQQFNFNRIRWWHTDLVTLQRCCQLGWAAYTVNHYLAHAHTYTHTLFFLYHQPFSRLHLFTCLNTKTCGWWNPERKHIMEMMAKTRL